MDAGFHRQKYSGAVTAVHPLPTARGTLGHSDGFLLHENYHLDIILSSIVEPW